MDQHSDPDLRAEPEPEAVPDPDTDAHRAKTGLESDDDGVSELTELTEISPPATVLVSHSNTKKARKKGAGSRRKTSRTKRRTLVVEDSVDIAQPVEEVEPEEEIEPEWRPPEDFVEWETVRPFSADFAGRFDDSMGMQICVTLNDWEHICERFEGATHYTEKTLYKLLSQHIVPAIIAELRVSRSFSKLRPRFEQKQNRRYNGSDSWRKLFHNANAHHVLLLKKTKRRKYGWLRSGKPRKMISSAVCGD
jgi:hypothetical protein